jgi:hypothetical protein
LITVATSIINIKSVSKLPKGLILAIMGWESMVRHPYHSTPGVRNNR